MSQSILFSAMAVVLSLISMPILLPMYLALTLIAFALELSYWLVMAIVVPMFVFLTEVRVIEEGLGIPLREYSQTALNPLYRCLLGLVWIGLVIPPGYIVHCMVSKYQRECFPGSLHTRHTYKK